MPKVPEVRHQQGADGMKWTRHEDERLTLMWTINLTADEIAEQLGISRGAVLGRVHRLKLPPRRKAYFRPKRFTENSFA